MLPTTGIWFEPQLVPFHGAGSTNSPCQSGKHTTSRSRQQASERGASRPIDARPPAKVEQEADRKAGKTEPDSAPWHLKVAKADGDIPSHL